LKAENYSLQQQLSAAGDNIDRQSIISQKDNEIADLQNQLKIAQSGNVDLASLQNQISQLTADKASLQSQLSAARSNSGSTADWQRQINNLRSEIATKDAKIKKLEKEKQALIDNM
jgi:predicted  nucleic acid-binding Zn-ribbon protein